MRRLTFPLLAVLCVLTPSSVLVAQSPPPSPFRGLIDHVTTNLSGFPADGTSEGTVHSLSGDGRYVVFSSGEWQFVADDYNWADDVFLRDRMTGVTTRLSVSEYGGDGDGLSGQAAISTNGRHVAFASGSSNLVSGDSNGHWDVFVRDLDANHTVRVSVATDDAQGDADSYWPAVSADGRYVAFISSSTTFAPNMPQYGPGQIYLHDRDADGNGTYDDTGGTTTSLVSIGIDMERADQMSTRPRVSADGRYVMFESDASNLDAVGSNGQHHLYLRDRQTEQTRMIDRAVTGGPSAWGVSWQGSDMSDDGRFITYSSVSQDIVPFDMNWIAQVFLYDAAAEPGITTSVISRTGDLTLANGSSYYTTVSGDGRFVGFMTAATNLSGPLEADHYGLVVRDNVEGTMTRVDVLENGAAFDGQYVFNPSLSADGTAIAFQSDAMNALNGYSWGQHHTFVATAFSVSPGSASFVQDGGSGSIEVAATAVSGWTAATDNDWIVLMDGQGFGAGPRTVTYLVNPNPAGIVRNGLIRLGSTSFAIHQEGDGDTTPPIITPIITGTQVNGWYTSDITVTWSITDPDSEIVSQAQCYSNTYTTDFMDAQPYCEATSHGGTAISSFHLRRDTTGPAITIYAPLPNVYAAGAIVTPSFSCYDWYAGSATCEISAGSLPLDTTPGRHTFSVTATDTAGNSSTQSVNYIVGTDQCVAPPAAPANLRHWFKFDGDRVDSIAGVATSGYYTYGTFPTGMVNQGWFNDQPWGFVYGWSPSEALAGPSGLTVAMWVQPQGWFYGAGAYPYPDYQTLVFNPMQYQVARWADGTLRWAFKTTTGFNWVNTGVVLATNAWQHVAVSYDAGVVQTFVNGGLVHSQALNGTLTTGADTGLVQIGGQSNGMIWNRSLKGMLDDVMIFDTALPASDIENLAVSGSGGLCAGFQSNVTVTAPATAYLTGQFMVRATLTDGLGRPLPSRPLTVTSTTSPGFVSQNLLTAEDGTIWVFLPTSFDAPIGEHADGITVSFAGDGAFAPVDGHASITVLPVTPEIDWSPAGVVYGTPLGAAQQNAVARYEGVEIPGTFVYSLPAGTLLDAGTHTVSVTYTPDDPHYTPVTTQRSQYVAKSGIHMGISNLNRAYNGLPDTANVSVTGDHGEPLSPFTVTYDGSTSAPVNAGTYVLQVQYAGSNNYIPATTTINFTISKATPTVTATGGTFTFDNQPHAGSGAAIGVLGETLTPVTLTYDGSSPTAPTQTGAHTVRASYAGSANYLAGQSANATLTINRATPTVDFDTTTVWYSGLPKTALVFVRGAGGVELNPITLRYNGSTTGPVNAGTYTLEVQYAGNSNYMPITATSPFVIRKNFPIFGTLNDFGMTYDGQPHGISANIIGVQNELLTPVITTYNGSTTRPTNAGAYTVVVGYNGSANYEADSRTFTMTIFKVIPSLNWFPSPSGITYGTPLGAGQLNATSNAPGSFAYTPAAGTVLNAGSHTVNAVFTPANPANYESGSIVRTINVAKAAAQATWFRPANIVYGTPLGATQLNATAPVPGTFTYSPAAGAVLNAGVDQILHVTFTPADSANYNGSSAAVPLTVDKVTPTVSWDTPSEIVYGTALGAAQLNATANTPGTFSYSPAAGAVLGAGARTLSVTFTPADAANYNTTTSSVTLNVAKAASTIGWSNPADIVYGAALGASQLNATANMPGTFSYSPAAGTVVGAGTQTLSVTFTPDDAANHNGSSSSVSLNVAKEGTTLNWSPAAALTYGTPLGVAQLNAFAVGVDGTFNYEPPAGTVLTAGIHTLSVTFTPNDPANYNGASATVLTEVSRAASTINWPAPAAIGYGTALGGAQLNATANVPGTFSYSPAIGGVLNVGWHTLSVTFTPDDAVNYVNATTSVALQVTKAASTITWSTPANIVYGTALGISQLNATANVPGTFSYSPAAGAVLNAGAQTLSVTFTPDDPANYNGASANVSLTVTKAASTISWSNPAGIVYGALLGGAQLNATANVPGTFSYSPAVGTVLGAGTQTLSVTFTPDDAANYASATANVSIAVAKAAPVVTWANPAGVTYGTALSGTQLNATANVSGSFVYSPAAGTVLNAGTNNLSVTFTPADGANYTTAGAAASIVIAPAALTVQANNAGKVYGQALPAFTASGTGFVNGNSMASLGGTLAFATSATATSTPGTYSVTPSGVSSPNYSITFAAGTLTVAKADTTLTLTTTPSPSQNNQSVQIRAVVAAVAPGAGTATGTVSFYENGTLLGSATLVNGVATMNKSFKRGTHPLTATYAAGANFNGSSGAVSHITQ